MVIVVNRRTRLRKDNVTLKTNSATINNFFTRAIVIACFISAFTVASFARSSGLTKKNIPSTRTADMIRSEKSAEKKGLNRHRLNQELMKNQISGVELDLMQSLKNDPDGIVRQGAAQGLGNYVQNPAVVMALSEALKTETEPAVRYACVLSLGLSNSFRSMNALEKLMNDPDANLRRQLAFSLKRQNNNRAKILLKKLQKDSDASVRSMAEIAP